MDDLEKQVGERIAEFRKKKDLDELRRAAAAIDNVDVHALPDAAQRQAARKSALSAWLVVLDAMDTETDPRFNPSDVPAMRVTVPADARRDPGAPLTSPATVTDPEVRRKYDQAVTKNSDKTRRYVFQKELAQLNKQLTKRAESFIGSAFLKSPESAKVMDEAVREHVHSAGRAASLKALVTR